MGLQQISPAYVAYKALGRLPQNAPTFEVLEGYPVVYTGVLYCRAPGKQNGLCGKVSSEFHNLVRHVERVHEVSIRSRIVRKRSKSHLEYQEAARFYEGLMKDETYDKTSRQCFKYGHVSNASGSREIDKYKTEVDKHKTAVRPKPPQASWTSPSVGDELNEDDDEEVGTSRLKQEKRVLVREGTLACETATNDAPLGYELPPKRQSGFDGPLRMASSERPIIGGHCLEQEKDPVKSERDFDTPSTSLAADTEATSPGPGSQEEDRSKAVQNASESMTMDIDVESLMLELEEVEMQEKVQKTQLQKMEVQEELERAQLRKIQLKRRLAARRYRRAA